MAKPLLSNTQLDALTKLGALDPEYANNLRDKTKAEQNAAIKLSSDNAVVEAEKFDSARNAQYMDDEIRRQKAESSTVASTEPLASYQNYSSSSSTPAPSSTQPHNVKVGGFTVDDNAPQQPTRSTQAPQPNNSGLVLPDGMTPTRYTSVKVAPERSVLPIPNQSQEPVASYDVNSSSASTPETTIVGDEPQFKYRSVGGGQPKSDKMEAERRDSKYIQDQSLTAANNAVNEEEAEKTAAEYQRQEKAYAEANAAAEEYSRQRYEESMTKISEIDAEITENRNTTIDPDAHWTHGLFGDNKTANKITAAFGMLLGAFGQGASMNGGNTNAQNQALVSFNQKVDQDIKNQEKNLANKHATTAQRMSLYGMWYQATGDRELAFAKTKEEVLKQSTLKLQSITADARSEKTKLAGSEALVKLTDEYDRAKIDAQKLAEKKAAAAAAAAYANSPSGQFAAFVKSHPNHPYAKLPPQQGYARWMAGRGVTDEVETINSTNAAFQQKDPNSSKPKEVSQAEIDHKDKMRDYDIMERVLAKREKGTVTAGEKAEFEAARQRLGVSIAKEAGPNATEKEVARAQEQLPDLDSYVGSKVKKIGVGVNEKDRVKALKERANAKLADVQKSYGVTPTVSEPQKPQTREK